MTKRWLSASEKAEAKRLKKLEKQRQKELQKQQRKASRKATYLERQRASNRLFAARSRASASNTNEIITGNENENPSNTELASNTVNDISTSYTSITTTNASTSSNVSTSDLNENNEMITVNENENPSNTENTSNTENVPILDPNDIPSIQECIDTIKDGSLPPISLGQHPSTKVLQEKFNNFMYNQLVHHCHYCKERWYGLDGEINNENNFECKKCISDMKKNVMQIRTLSSENDLDPKIESMYHLLPELNDIEEMFIARVHVVMKVFQIGNGNIGYKGNVLNIEQDI